MPIHKASRFFISARFPCYDFSSDYPVRGCVTSQYVLTLPEEAILGYINSYFDCSSTGLINVRQLAGESP